MKILVTGSSGLIGGACVEYFDQKGHTIIGVDNNTREQLFGKEGRVWWNLHRIFHYTKRYTPINLDITNREEMRKLFEHHGPFDAVIHCAAQPSHDKSREIPFQDFTINAYATAHLLELTRTLSPNAHFVFMSTNKVYGDAPNEKSFVEYDMRFDSFSDRWKGFDENTRVDQSTHSPFGASKAAADLLTQEYGRYFGLKTTVLRAGCLTGPGHSGVQLHGFLSYLLKCAINGTPYTIFGYKGKQVRDNLHSKDVARIIEQIITNSNAKPGEVYNIGGGRENSCSILEAIALIEEITGRKIDHTYVDQPRVGDHICYITDMSKFFRDHPGFELEKSLRDTLNDMARMAYWGKESDHDKTFLYPELNENSIVIDAGGHRGAWADSIIKRYNPNVIIYEPIKGFAEACMYRFKDNPKVKIFNEGLSNFSGSESISVDGVASSLYTGEKTELVKLVDIKKAAASWPEMIDLISINVEGAEYALLERLLDEGLIERFRNVQVQFHKVVSGWSEWRNNIRSRLSKTHYERFCYGPLVWESWKIKES